MKEAHSTFRFGKFLVILGIILPFTQHSGGFITGFIVIGIGITLMVSGIKMEAAADVDTYSSGINRLYANLRYLNNMREKNTGNIRKEYERQIREVEARINQLQGNKH